MIRKLLCRIGLHKWRLMRSEGWSGWSEQVHRKCLACGENEHVTFISPLSGPYKIPLHPEAPK